MIFVAFLLPLAIYCAILGLINRRRHPLMVSGPWDFVGVLLATSGLLIVGGPAILTGLYSQWRYAWLLGQTRWLRGIGENWSFWLGVWIFYFVAVVGGALYCLYRRRHFVAIYNIEPSEFDEAFTRTLERLQLANMKHGADRTLVYQPATDLEADSGRLPAGESDRAPVLLASRTTGAQSTWVGLKVSASGALHHVGLTWDAGSGQLRTDIEKELASALAELRTRNNPLGFWFLTLSAGLFTLTFFGLLALILLDVLMRGPR